MGCGIAKENTKSGPETSIKNSSIIIPSRILKLHHKIIKKKKIYHKLKTIVEVNYRFEQSL